jgi:hypothetical protein
VATQFRDCGPFVRRLSSQHEGLLHSIFETEVLPELPRPLICTVHDLNSWIETTLLLGTQDFEQAYSDFMNGILAVVDDFHRSDSVPVFSSDLVDYPP